MNNLDRDRLQRACDRAARAASRARRWRLAIEAAPDDGADEDAAGRRRDARVAWEDAFSSLLGDVQSWYYGPSAGLDFEDLFAADPRLEALIDEFHQAAE